MPDPPVAQQRLLEQYFAQSTKRFPKNPIVLSEGDSWFSFPGHANTIDHLDELTKREMSLLRLEESGDTLLRMTSGAQRAQLRHLLTIYKVDALLFSGGGNDVVGPELLDLFKNVPAGGDWRKSIRQDVMDLQFRQIADAYNTLALVRDAYRPNCLIITHGYDYVQPSGKPTKFWLWPIPLNVTVGPWIKTHLETIGIDTPQDQTDVVKFLIDEFNAVLATVASTQKRFIAIDNRTLLKKTDFADELHPTRNGFKKIAQSFHNVLKKELPEKFSG